MKTYVNPSHPNGQSSTTEITGEPLSLTFYRDVMDTDPVLAFPDETPLKLDGLTHAWKRIAKKAGIEGVTLHGARHSHATSLLKAGTHPKVVQERLGHASIMTTLDLYSHTVPGLQEQAVADLEKAIENAR